jgi:hypothetical protein
MSASPPASGVRSRRQTRIAGGDGIGTQAPALVGTASAQAEAALHAEQVRLRAESARHDTGVLVAVALLLIVSLFAVGYTDSLLPKPRGEDTPLTEYSEDRARVRAQDERGRFHVHDAPLLQACKSYWQAGEPPNVWRLVFHLTSNRLYSYF